MTNKKFLSADNKEVARLKAIIEKLKAGETLEDEEI